MPGTRPVVALVSHPYYLLEARWDGETRSLAVEGVILPELPVMLRASLLTLERPGLSRAPDPEAPAIEPEPWPRIESALLESLREILETGDKDKPPFEFEGLRGLVKAVLTLGRYKPYKPTPGLLARSAYAYVAEVLGITSVPRLSPRGLAWMKYRVHLEGAPPRLAPALFEAWDGSVWRVDRVMTRLARENPEIFIKIKYKKYII